VERRQGVGPKMFVSPLFGTKEVSDECQLFTRIKSRKAEKKAGGIDKKRQERKPINFCYE